MLDLPVQGPMAAAHTSALAGAAGIPPSHRRELPWEDGDFDAVIDTYLDMDAFTPLLPDLEPKPKKPGKARSSAGERASL